MKNDAFQFKPNYLESSKHLFDTHFALTQGTNRIVISIGGQSGCGKTVLAHALAELFKQINLKCLLIGQDDYFHLPPLYNHLMRVQDLNWVGTGEVNLSLLQRHINDFKAKKIIYVPEIDYTNNNKEYRVFNTVDFDVLIIEGTYVTLLEDIDKKLFINIGYQDTLASRKSRARDVIDDFSDSILSVEEKIIISHKSKADVITEGFLIQ